MGFVPLATPLDKCLATPLSLGGTIFASGQLEFFSMSVGGIHTLTPPHLAIPAHATDE